MVEGNQNAHCLCNKKIVDEKEKLIRELWPYADTTNADNRNFESENLAHWDLDASVVEQVKPFNDDDRSTSGIIVKLKDCDTFIVSFRGSEETKDWIYNAEILKINWNPKVKSSFIVNLWNSIFHRTKARVHTGFLYDYVAVRKQVKSILDGFHFNPKQSLIYTTGHSLGGVLGAMAALDFCQNYKYQNVVVCTYGSPRPGNKEFAELYNFKVPNSFRIVNNKDIFCRLPPKEPPLNYCSYAKKWYLDDLLNKPDPSYDPDVIGKNIAEIAEDLLQYIEDAVKEYDLSQYLKDHLRDSYREKILQLPSCT